MLRDPDWDRLTKAFYNELMVNNLGDLYDATQHGKLNELWRTFLRRRNREARIFQQNKAESSNGR